MFRVDLPGGGEGERSYWLWKIPLAGQLALATWHLKSFAHAKANTHARNHIHAQQTQIFASRTQTYWHTHTYICVCLIRRRSEPSTAQFRNFYGKSSLIKFNELWKRQQISRGQLCCKVCPRWYFLWVDVRRQRQATASTSTPNSWEAGAGWGFDLRCRCKLADVIFVGCWQHY